MGGGDEGGAAAQRAVAVPRGRRRRRGAVADWSFGTFGRGVHAVGGAVTQGGVAEGRVVEAAGREVNGAQDRARVRNFGKRRQCIWQVVIIIWREKGEEE